MKHAIQPIASCTGGHCLFHFPQFEALRPDELRTSLQSILKDGADPKSYFVTAYAKHGNVKSTIEIVELALQRLTPPLTMERFVEAATLLYSFSMTEREAGRSVYLGSEAYYLDKRGGIAVFQPCCR